MTAAFDYSCLLNNDDSQYPPNALKSENIHKTYALAPGLIYYIPYATSNYPFSHCPFQESIAMLFYRQTATTSESEDASFNQDTSCGSDSVPYNREFRSTCNYWLPLQLAILINIQYVYRKSKSAAVYNYSSLHCYDTMNGK